MERMAYWCNISLDLHECQLRQQVHVYKGAIAIKTRLIHYIALD